MAIPILNHIDLQKKSQLKGALLENVTTLPSSPGTGQIVFDSDEGSGAVKFYNGSGWVTLASSTGTVTSVAITGTDGIQVDSGSPITSSGTIQLGLSGIANDKLSNSTVSYGGVSLSLGGSDATPAFDLTDATNYPTSSLSGTITNAQLAGSIAASKLAGSIGNSKLSNSTVSYGGVSLALGASDATPAFDLTDATNYPTSSLTGTITNAQLAGSIANAKLANNSITIDGSAIALGGSVSTLQLGTTSTTALAGNTEVDNVSITNLGTRLPQISSSITIGDATDVTVTTSGDLVVTGDLTVSGDTISANVATLDVEDKNITLNKSAGDSSSTANGAGLTIQDAVNSSTDATLLWDATNDEFDFSHPINVTGKVTATGTSVFANLDISGDVDVDGTLETDALSINGTSVSSTATELNFLDGSTAGTVVASKAVVVDSNKDIASFRNVTLTGELDAATLDISGNADIDGTLEADAITVNGTALNTVIDNRIKVVQKTATVDVSSLVNNVFKCNIAHGMNSNNLIVKLYDSSTFLDVFADVDRTDANTLQITFSHEPSNDIVVVIQEIIGDNIGAGSDITYPSS